MMLSLVNSYFKKYEGEAWSSLLPITKVIGNLLLFPVMLSTFSEVEVTLWLLILTTNSMILLVDFGFSPTFIRLVSYVSGRDSYAIQNQQYHKTVTFTLTEILSLVDKIYAVLGLLVVLISIVISYTLFDKVIDEIEDSSSIENALPFLMSSMGLVVYFTKNNVFLFGIREISTLKKAETIFSIINYSVMLITILIMRDYLITITLYFIMLISNGLIIALIAKKFRAPRPDTIKINPLLAGTVFNTAWRSGVGVLFGFCLTQGLGIYASQKFSVDEVGSFLLMMRLVQVSASVIKPIFYTKLPQLSEMYANASSNLILELAMSRIKTMLALQVCAYIILYTLGNTLLTMMNSSLMLPPFLIFASICLVDFCISLGSALLQVQTLNNKVHWHTANGIPVLLLLLFVSITTISELSELTIVHLLIIVSTYMPYCIVKFLKFKVMLLKREF